MLGWLSLSLFFYVVDECVCRVVRFVVRLGEVFEDFWHAHREQFVYLLLAHLDDLIRSVLGRAAHILMQSLQGRILLEELHNRVIARLLPIEHDSNLHQELQSVSICPIFRQNEVNIVLLAHPVNDIEKVLLLYLPRLYILLLPLLLDRLLSLFLFFCLLRSTFGPFFVACVAEG